MRRKLPGNSSSNGKMKTENSWRLIETGAGEPVMNMAFDWALLQLRGEGRIPDTLRLYTWKKRTVSLGYSQDINKELDVSACRKAGLSMTVCHRSPHGEQ